MQILQLVEIISGSVAEPLPTLQDFETLLQQLKRRMDALEKLDKVSPVKRQRPLNPSRVERRPTNPSSSALKIAHDHRSHAAASAVRS